MRIINEISCTKLIIQCTDGIDNIISYRFLFCNTFLMFLLKAKYTNMPLLVYFSRCYWQHPLFCCSTMGSNHKDSEDVLV